MLILNNGVNILQIGVVLLFQMRPLLTASRRLLGGSLSRGVYSKPEARPPDSEAAAIEGLDSTDFDVLQIHN